MHYSTACMCAKIKSTQNLAFPFPNQYIPAAPRRTMPVRRRAVISVVTDAIASTRPATRRDRPLVDSAMRFEWL